MTPDLLESLRAAKAEKRPVVLATSLPDGARQFLLPDPAGPAALNAAAERALAADRSGTTTIDGAEWFLQAHNPPVRLIIIGAVHIAQALAPFASQVGFAVTVVDPRRAFATDERFPEIAMMSEWPDEALEALKPDSRTAVVALTHDPKLDDVAIDRALRSPAFYIGALGSRRNAANRLKRLREFGHDDAALARIHGPIGLSIEAITPPEIALAIIAQLVAERRRGAKPSQREPAQQAA